MAGRQLRLTASLPAALVAVALLYVTLQLGLDVMGTDLAEAHREHEEPVELGLALGVVAPIARALRRSGGEWELVIIASLLVGLWLILAGLLIW
jgi:hypothetical protein